jgi:hypothetical protein
VYGNTDPTLTYVVTGAINKIVDGVLIDDSGSTLVSGNLARVIGENVGQYTINQGTVANISASSPGKNYVVTSYTSNTFSITPRPIVVTADTQTKTYGTNDPTLTYTVSPSGVGTGLASGDSLSNVLSGTIVRNLYGTVPGEMVGTYAINQGTLVAGSNYSLQYVPANLTINPAPLSVTANANTKVYGNTDPSLTYVVTGAINKVVDGVVINDSTSALVSGNLVRVIGENVGQYTINQGTVANISASSPGKNYVVTSYTSNLFSITPRPITITADTQTKTYGTNDPNLTYTATASGVGTGLASGDSLANITTGALTRAQYGTLAGESVGVYNVTQGSLAVNNNYSLKYVPATLTITPAQLNVTANSATKIYGDSDPGLTYTATGVVNRVVDGVQISDSLSTVVGGSLVRVTGENVGPYTINQGTIASVSKNYTLNSYTPNTFTITPAVLTVVVEDNAKFVYQPDPNPLAVVSYIGFKGSDTLANTAGFKSATLSRESGSQPGEYALRASGASATNYTMNYQYTNTPTSFTNCGATDCSKFTILGAGSLNVTLQPISYVYGTSSTNLPLASLTASTPIATYCAYPCTDPNSLKNVVLTSNGLNSFSGSVTGLIAQGTTGTSTFTFNLQSTYNSANPTTRVVGNYLITASQVAVKTYDASNPPNQLSSLTNNYPNTSNITYTNGAFTNFVLASDFLTITPLPISVTASNAVKVYDASTQATTGGNTVMTTSPTPVLTGATTSLPFGDQITSLNYVYTDPNVGASNKVVQVSNVQMANGVNNPLSNYQVTYVNNTTSTITPRPITINGDAQTKVYGTNDPSLTYTATATGVGTGVAPGDSLATIVSGSLTRSQYGTLPGENTGTYGITQGTLASNSNYAVTYVPSTLTVTPAQITVAANPMTKIYGSSDPTLTYIVNGAINQIVDGVLMNDIPSSLVSGSLVRNFGENVGQYLINQGTIVSSSQNYTLSGYTSNKFTITPLPISVTASNAVKVYDASTLATTGGNTVMTTSPTPALTGVTTSLPFGDQITSLNYVYTDPNVGAANKIVQVSNVQMANGANNPLSNYLVTYVNNTTSTITPRPITVNGDNLSKMFGSNDPALTYAAVPSALGTGLAPGQSLANVITGSLTRDKFGTVPGEYVGQYAINQGSLAANSNYALRYVPGSLNIGPYQGAITVIANPIIVSYGNTLPPYSYNINSPIGNIVNVDGVKLDLASFIFTGNISANLPSIYSSSNNLPVSVYPITQGTLQTSSFTSITFIPSTVTVNPLPIYLNGLSAQSKNFDGTTKATVTGSINITGLLSPDQVNTSPSSFASSYNFATAAPSTNIPVSPTTPYSQLVSGLGLIGVDAKNYYIAGYSFPLSAEIRAVPDQGAMGVIIAGGIFSNSEYASGGYNPPSTLMVAYSHIPGVPKLLFPDQSNFIKKTRLFPFDNTKPMDLGIKVGTAYDTINPMDYKVIPDIYEMKINSGDTNSSQR